MASQLKLSELLNFLQAWCRVDFGTCDENIKSRTIIFITFNSNGILWKYKAQSSTKRSTAEENFYSLPYPSQDLLLLRDILNEKNSS